MEIFTAKLFKGTGLTDWVRVEPGSASGDGTGTDIVLDGAGNLLIGGKFTGTTDFNGGASTIASCSVRGAFGELYHKVSSKSFPNRSHDPNIRGPLPIFVVDICQYHDAELVAGPVSDQ